MMTAPDRDRLRVNCVLCILAFCRISAPIVPQSCEKITFAELKTIPILDLPRVLMMLTVQSNPPPALLSKAIKFFAQISALRKSCSAPLCAGQQQLRVKASTHHMTDDTSNEAILFAKEAALAASESRFRQLVEQLPQLVWTCGTDGACDYLGPQWIAYTGVPEAEQLGFGWINQVHPEDRARLRSEWRRTVTDGAHFAVEFRIRRNDGIYRWFKTQALPLRNEAGVIVKWLGSNTDIEELKRADSERQNAAKRSAFLLALSDSVRQMYDPQDVLETSLNLLLEQLHLDRCHVSTVDLANGTVTVLHQECRSHFPPLPEALHTADFPEALRLSSLGTLIIDDTAAAPNLESSERAAFAALGIGAMVSVFLRKGENCPIWALVATSGAPRTWEPDDVALLEQAAERVWSANSRARDQLSLLRSEARFRSLTLATSNIIWSINAGGLVDEKHEGPSWPEFTGQTNGEWSGVGWLKAIHPDDRSRVVTLWEQALGEQTIYQSEYRLRRHDGEYRWMAATSVPLFSPSGKIIEWIGTISDITDRKRAEEHLRLLLREVNHRSKNLLTIVQSMALHTAFATPHEFIARFTDRLKSLSISQDLLIENRWEGVELGVLIRTQLGGFADLIGNRITVQGNKLQVSAAAAQTLGMALHELATNAGKYGALTTTTGRIAVTWGVDGDHFTLAWTETEGPAVHPPSQSGFGTTVLTSVPQLELEAVVTLDYPAEGVTWRLTCPTTNVLYV